MKYYFFRDLDNHMNFSDERSYHASGYVEKLYSPIGKPSRSGKDVAVCFWHPFDGGYKTEWRAFKEIQLFEVEQWEYELLLENNWTTN